MLFNEPKLLKFCAVGVVVVIAQSFSALQRAEIAEMPTGRVGHLTRFGFSALQRAEIAEIGRRARGTAVGMMVSVLFNEPKLLKSRPPLPAPPVSQIPIPARRRS